MLALLISWLLIGLWFAVAVFAEIIPGRRWRRGDLWQVPVGALIIILLGSAICAVWQYNQWRRQP